MENIKSIDTENVGGGNYVDFIELWDGRILAISDEYIVLYKSMEDFWESRSDIHYQSIDLTCETYLP